MLWGSAVAGLLPPSDTISCVHVTYVQTLRWAFGAGEKVGGGGVAE